MIHIQDLADYIEKQRAAGRELFKQMNS
ncbi:pyocin activator PrtN family protein [Kosakonia oryziphila]|jgi:hypothetical protein|nr:pyocin activator PrtN family protein [Kosakonia oryziphila]